LGVIPIGSVISEIPIMQTSKSISTWIVATPKKALKPAISKNKVGGRLEVLLKTTPSSPSNTYGCISNKKKDYDSDYSLMSAHGMKNIFRWCTSEENQCFTNV
jgi:hypothetical protein